MGQSPILKSLKSNFLQRLRLHATMHVGLTVLPLNPAHGTIDNAREFRAEFRRPASEEALLRFFRRKPTRITIRFLRPFQTRDFAQVRGDAELGTDIDAVLFAPEITGEGHFLYPAMHSGLFHRFERR